MSEALRNLPYEKVIYIVIKKLDALLPENSFHFVNWPEFYSIYINESVQKKFEHPIAELYKRYYQDPTLSKSIIFDECDEGYGALGVSDVRILEIPLNTLLSKSCYYFLPETIKFLNPAEGRPSSKKNNLFTFFSSREFILSESEMHLINEEKVYDICKSTEIPVYRIKNTTHVQRKDVSYV